MMTKRNRLIMSSLLLLLACLQMSTMNAFAPLPQQQQSVMKTNNQLTILKAERRRHVLEKLIVGTMGTTLFGWSRVPPNNIPLIVSLAYAADNNAKKSASPQIYTTPNGIKYAILKDSASGGSNFLGAGGSGTTPKPGDIVAIEYTGYLTDGRIFDATHAQGKSNALLFQFGSDAVITGITEVLSQIKVGQKVQAIIPPSFAFGDKGICLEGSEGEGECLVKPGQTLVYDIFLKRSSIPPP